MVNPVRSSHGALNTVFTNYLGIHPHGKTSGYSASNGVKDISLYIPCYNVEKTIAECIEAVINQTYPISEIIIVDDGSTDNTVSIASKYNVRIIQHNANLGLAASRNTGVLNSKNEYIASLDADCVPYSDWLERLIKTFTQDNVAGAGGKLLEVKLDTLADRWRARHLVQNWGDKTIINPRQLFGNNTIFRKSCLLEIGLYNPIYKTNFEDYDISQRLMKKGYTLIYEPSANVGHIRSDNVYSVMNTYTRYYRGILVNLFFSASFLIKDLLKGKFSLLPLDVLSLIWKLGTTPIFPKKYGGCPHILAFHWGDWPRPDPNGPQCGPLVELSKNSRILVVDSPITLLSPFIHRKKLFHTNEFVFSPLLLLPYHPRLPIPTFIKKILNKINNPLIYFQVKKRLKKLGISNPILWLSMLHPVELIDIFKPRLTCVLCYDEVSTSPIFTKSQQMLIKEFEERLLKRADIVFTTSKRLYNNKIKINPKTYLIPNAVEKEFIDRVNIATPDPLEKIKSPRIGYVGKINIRLDLELIYNTAQNRPDWNWIFIGPIEHGADKILKKIKNVHLLGETGHFEIANYLKHFDILTIPFKINEYTKNMNPLKLYQYLASGKPIISTNLPEITEFNNTYPGLVYISRDTSEFVKSIEEGLKENDDRLTKKRLDTAYDNTWEKRAQLISKIINENTPHI